MHILCFEKLFKFPSHLCILSHEVHSCNSFGKSNKRSTLRPSPHDMNRQECRTKRIDSVCGVTWILLCARDGSVIKWGRGEGETLLIHVVLTRCALGLICIACFPIHRRNNSHPTPRISSPWHHLHGGQQRKPSHWSGVLPPRMRHCDSLCGRVPQVLGSGGLHRIY